jgi:hypothetical protein
MNLTLHTVPATENQPVKKSLNLVRILALVALALILGMSITIGTVAKPASTLNATMQWDNSQFRITNNNNFPWNEVYMVLNYDYKLKVAVITEHTELVALPEQFVKDDGTPFNASTMSPFNFYMTGQIPKNQTGSWFYKFQ